jgi:predicted secreted acid phosphatase
MPESQRSEWHPGTLRRRASAKVAFLAVALFGCGVCLASADDCPPKRTMHVPDPVPPLNLDEIKNQLRAYHQQDYDADIAATVADARDWLESRAAKVTKPALVLDIDETSLSNWPNLLANDLGFIRDGSCARLPNGPCGFNAWVLRHRAVPIAPTRSLFNTARTRGVSVFFITGRHEVQRRATVFNLHEAGYRAWTKLVMRADSDTKRTVQAYKTEARSKISAQGFDIIANLGDQSSDLDGGYAQCTFKLPNPFYFAK